MAKPLLFQFQGVQVEYLMSKVDRAKLYGYKELEVIDEQGTKCDMGILAEDGHTLLGKGGTGMGYLSADGLWCDKSQLKPVDVEGNPIQPVTSSFAAPIVLTEQQLAAPEDYLSHTIRSIYLMETVSGGTLEANIKKGSIYKFPYSFRGGLESDTAFLLSNESGATFMAVGRPALIEFIGLQQAVGITEDDVADDQDGDEMDFGMI
jgi:hypothetical protein